MKQLFTLFLSIFSFFAFAQFEGNNFKVSEDGVFDGRIENVRDVIGVIDNNVIIHHHDFIKLIDSNGGERASISLTGLKHENGVKKTFEAAIIFNERLVFLFKVYDKKAMLTHFILDEYDTTNLKFKTNLCDVTSSNDGGKEKSRFEPGGPRSFFLETIDEGFYTSDNGKYLVFFTNGRGKGVGANEQVGLIVFNESLEVAWKKDFVLDYPASKLSIVNMKPDNSGGVHLIGLEDAAQKEAKGEPFRRLLLFSFYNNGNTIKSEQVNFSFNLKGWALSNLDDRYLLLTGPFSSKNTFLIDGIFSVKIDTETQEMGILDNREINFISNQIGKINFSAAGLITNDNKIAYKVSIPIYYSDGSYIVIAEKIDTDLTYSNSGDHVRCVRTSDAVLVGFNASGEVRWSGVLSKDYSSTFQRSISSVSVTCGEDLIIVYNERQSETLSVNELKGSELWVATISKDGRIGKERLYANAKDPMMLAPIYSHQIDDCETFLFSVREKNCQINFLRKE